MCWVGAPTSRRPAFVDASAAELMIRSPFREVREFPLAASDALNSQRRIAVTVADKTAAPFSLEGVPDIAAGWRVPDGLFGTHRWKLRGCPKRRSELTGGKKVMKVTQARVGGRLIDKIILTIALALGIVTTLNIGSSSAHGYTRHAHHYASYRHSHYALHRSHIRFAHLHRTHFAGTHHRGGAYRFARHLRHHETRIASHPYHGPVSGGGIASEYSGGRTANGEHMKSGRTHRRTPQPAVRHPRDRDQSPQRTFCGGADQRSRPVRSRQGDRSQSGSSACDRHERSRAGLAERLTLKSSDEQHYCEARIR